MVFRNILAANDKYCFRDCENLSSAIQMHLSLKAKKFSGNFVQFLEPTSNFKHFEQKDDRHSYFILKIKHCEKIG